MESTRLNQSRQSYEWDDEASNSTPLDELKLRANPYRQEKPRPLSQKWMSSPIWFICTALLLLVVVGQTLYNTSRMHGSFDRGFPTEWKAVKPTISTSQRRFTSPIRAYDNGTLYMIFADGEPRYTTSGATFEEVDKAWDDLLRGRYVQLKDSEIAWMNEDTFNPDLDFINLDYPGKMKPGTYGGPDMLHSLHCLNALRKHLDVDHYGNHLMLPEEYRRMHIDHCIDQLRQAILCHGDMTPVTLKRVNLSDHKIALLGETERMHTCRNGPDLRKWWWNRGDETGRLTVAE